MNRFEVNAAEGAIYALSAAGLMLLVVATFFVWRVLKAPAAAGEAPSHHNAE